METIDKTWDPFQFKKKVSFKKINQSKKIKKVLQKKYLQNIVQFLYKIIGTHRIEEVISFFDNP